MKWNWLLVIIKRHHVFILIMPYIYCWFHIGHISSSNWKELKLSNTIYILAWYWYFYCIVLFCRFFINVYIYVWILGLHIKSHHFYFLKCYFFVENIEFKDVLCSSSIQKCLHLLLCIHDIFMSALFRCIL